MRENALSSLRAIAPKKMAPSLDHSVNTNPQRATSRGEQLLHPALVNHTSRVKSFIFALCATTALSHCSPSPSVHALPLVVVPLPTVNHAQRPHVFDDIRRGFPMLPMKPGKGMGREGKGRKGNGTRWNKRKRNGGTDRNGHGTEGNEERNGTD